MRCFLFTLVVTLAWLLCTAHATRVTEESYNQGLDSDCSSADETTQQFPQNWSPTDYNQNPIMDKGGPKGQPIISDVLPKTRAINIFSSLTRDFEPIASRLNDASKNVTVLAPRTNAIMALPRKPWEDPEEYNQFGSQAYEGKDGQDRARKNLRRFVEAHLVPLSPWEEGKEVKSLGGGNLKWTKDGDKILVSAG